MGINTQPAMPEPQWKRLIETFPGIHICCRSYGTGERTLLMLHGNAEDYRCFSRQIESFSERYHLILVDSRGHGGSTVCYPLTLDAMADDLERIMKALTIDRVSVIGFSDGGNAALTFAMKYPHRIDRLVVAGGNLFPGGLAKSELTKTQWQWWMWHLCRKFSVHAQHKAALLELMVFQPMIAPVELEQIKAPVLVLAGSKDVILEEHTRLIARSLPHARLRFIPSCGHYIFREQPRWVNETILRFLADPPAAQPLN